MPIGWNKTPGSAKGVPPEVKPPAEEGEQLRIRILKPVASRYGHFKPGDVTELPAVIARSWIGFRFAEQDKMLDAAPETKAVEPEPAQKKRRK